jgi:signal transduction histidine kinase
METGSMEMTKEDWIQRIHPNEVEEVRKLIQLAVRERGQYSHEFRVESGREERWVMEIGRATYGDDGEGLTMAGISVDITERVKLREEMLRQKKQEQDSVVEASQRKDEFLALLAHELRTPLSPVRTGIEILKNRDLPPEEANKILETVEKQTAHMVHLIDDLLDISRVTQGKLNLRMARVNLKTVLEDAVEATKPFLEEKGHRLSMSICTAPLAVFGDESRLLQVFSNLVNNAAKYTPPGGQIVVHAELVGNEIFVTVEDDGEGIDAAMQESIFELFGQVVHPDRVSNGLGIGLSLVRSLIERHEGSVEVQSEGRGMGSRFTVRLPVLRAAMKGDLLAFEAVADGNPHADPGYRKILVVDDSPSAADILVMFLEMEGFKTSAAYDGPAALAAMASLNPDLVFMDIGMPGISGYDVAREIRRMPDGRKVTLVALTGWGQESDRTKAMDAGFDFHLTKPVSPETIRKFLSGKLAAG